MTEKIKSMTDRQFILAIIGFFLLFLMLCSGALFLVFGSL